MLIAQVVGLFIVTCDWCRHVIVQTTCTYLLIGNFSHGSCSLVGYCGKQLPTNLHLNRVCSFALKARQTDKQNNFRIYSIRKDNIRLKSISQIYFVVYKCISFYNHVILDIQSTKRSKNILAWSILKTSIPLLFTNFVHKSCVSA